MNVRFEDEHLHQMETDPQFDGGYEQGVAKKFRMVMNVIRQAPDERDFYQLKSLHFEKLRGSRSEQRSMRLNQQWRLIVRIEDGSPKTIVIVGIEDYH